jgi:predicted TIM-barrel fold metal-dependent hydrolase
MAPGAFDLNRRKEVLDFTGVRRQLMFPGGMGLWSAALLTQADNLELLSSITGDRRGYARKLMRAYNDWCIRESFNSDRMRPVALLVANDPAELLAEAQYLVSRGIRAVWMPSAVPPGGASPADDALDPVYDLLAREKIVLCAHVGADMGFLRLSVWNKAHAFQGFRHGEELSLDPWALCSQARAAENFVLTMVVGGVFERHPELRMCVSELGAEWIGPLAYRMDLWIHESGVFNKKNKDWRMRLKPSEYVNRNIRVTPFYFEDVATYIERYDLADVYCYGSDYPHIEGGTNPMGDFSKNLATTSDVTKRKFFVENGKWALPD